MRKLLFLGFALFMIIQTYGQINMNDSTVQVTGFWDKNEKQTYFVTNHSYKVKDSDTLSSDIQQYKVDITIVDSTEHTYTIDWHYYDYEFFTENELLKKLSSLAENLTVTIMTDEYGLLLEVKNWEDIKKMILKATKQIKEEIKDIPNVEKVIKQIEDMYSSKESIEAGAIREIQQFYTYHGGMYKLHDTITATIQVPNLYGGLPFDSEVTLWLDEINAEDNNSIIRMQLLIDSVQIKKVTFDYLTQLAETLDVAGPVWEEFPPIQNETLTASRIHSSGWVLYSVETQIVSAEGFTNIKENIIEIQ